MAGDRALDAEVAEQVFGRRVRWNTWRDEVYLDDFPDLPAGLSTALVPFYSSEIADAWELVEELGLLVTPTLTGGWGAGQFKGTTGHPDGGRRYCVPGTWAEAEDAPEAICRAALAVAAPKPD